MSDKNNILKNFTNKKTISYLGLFFVLFVWGAVPLIILHLYKYYSPTIRVFFSQAVLLIAYMLMSGKHLREFNLVYIKIGIPTGLFLALANISQKIGLMYTTPARYAFLENLSCISVPVLMYFLVKKKPVVKTVLSCFLCLASVFVLNGISFDGASSWGIGEILCALSGLLYGFNIAGTAAFAKKLYAPMYLAVQSGVGIIVSLIFSLVLNYTTVTSASGVQVPLEKIVFSFKAEHILLLVLITVFSSALCWTIRTNAMKHIDASIISVIMPFSAVITGVLSVLFGNDTLDINLIAGGILGVAAVLISINEDMKRKN